MKILLKVAIILMLLKKIHPEGCRTDNGRLVCENVALKKGIPLAIKSYKEVWSIDFDYCTISVVPSGVFQNFYNTTVIWLDNSEVRTIEPGAFNGMPKLQVLHLERNGIIEIQQGVFDGLENLQSINLDDNHLLKINKNYFSNLPRLITLRLENNNIKLISENAFENLPNLENLLLRHNTIKNLEKFGNLQNLIKLDLAFNLLTHINCEFNYPRLSQLYLDHNDLSDISKNCFKNLTNLNELNLNDNKFETIDAKNIFRCLPHFSNVRLNKNSWRCHSLLNTIETLYFYYNITIKDADTTNSTNVYGIACKWNHDDLDMNLEGNTACNGYSDLVSDRTVDMAKDESSTPTETVYDYTGTSENGEMFSDFTSQIPNTSVLCRTNCAPSVNVMLLSGLAVISSLLIIVISCVFYRKYHLKNSNSYEVKKNVAMVDL